MVLMLASSTPSLGLSDQASINSPTRLAHLILRSRILAKLWLTSYHIPLRRVDCALVFLFRFLDFTYPSCDLHFSSLESGFWFFFFFFLVSCSPGPGLDALSILSWAKWTVPKCLSGIWGGIGNQRNWDWGCCGLYPYYLNDYHLQLTKERHTTVYGIPLILGNKENQRLPGHSLLCLLNKVQLLVGGY